ncbi:prolyl oligopeptidase family serine peptidase [Marinifilum sp.]|uniref:S9 family peptidase n=1 Tax=Marinifilum sp. TaxID=2033137 RepID=UPI003BAA05BC
MRIIYLLVFVALSHSVLAQISVNDYKRADSTYLFNSLVTHHQLEATWLTDSTFWYKTNGSEGIKYKLVSTSSLNKKELFRKDLLLRQYNSLFGTNKKSDSFSLKNLKVDNEANTLFFEAENYHCTYFIDKDKLEKGKAVEKKEDTYWATSKDDLDNDPVLSPDSIWMAYIKNYNVFVKNLKTKEETQLSNDGSAGDLYSAFLKWSSDSKKLATFKVRQHHKQYFYMIESSPKDQLQPKLHKREYLKPGDVVPIRRPALFSVEDKKQIHVDGSAFEHQFYAISLKWRNNSSAFTFEYNERGHQKYQVVKVDATSGKITILAEEKSKTYVEYIQNQRWDLNDGEEMIWKSERDGWFHFYLIDGNTGKIKNQITKGDFYARDIIHVDEEKREMIFSANGVKKGADPYLLQYYQIKLDGSKMKNITPEEAHHKAWFNESKTLLVDKYSKVDKAPITVLRDAKSGKKLMTIEQSDVSKLQQKGWQYPEVFTAKGRDDKTDIWGIIYRPSNFDPNKKYPILEYIYAGPGRNHVPKNFFAYEWKFSSIAELGFIVVQIDGMGTGYRSKAFADVAWKNLKDAGLPDRIKWIKEAAKKYPYMDINKVGIYGGSAGGQSSTAAVLQYPDFYKVAVSACGCHDNRMDKIWWNELWMGYPIDKSYKENSNVTMAKNLEGKLMLILGELDDNVDPSSTLQVVDALIKAGKEFEFVILPGVGHTLGGKFGERKRRDFFIKHLMGIEPPNWNK